MAPTTADTFPVAAAADIGSTSVHLVVARVVDHRLEPLDDRSAFLGLGATIDRQAHLGRTETVRLVETLTEFVEGGRALGAGSIVLMGTEPLRRAADAATVVVEVERATGVPLHVLTHEEEAYVTLLGVTEGRPVTRRTLVLDIGGGSSEFCSVGPGGRARAAGLRLGAERLTARVGAADPPTPKDVAAMRAIADELLGDAYDDDPQEVVAVGGTATNLLKVAPGGTADRTLTRARLAETLALLVATPAAIVAERHLVRPARARLLPAGAVIVDAVLRRHALDSLTVSDAGMREGAVLAAAHAGRAWRDRLPALAHGWRG